MTRKPTLLAALLLCALGADAAGQTVLQSGDIGVVTTTGFRRLLGGAPGALPVNDVPASAFGGVATLAAPGVEWETGTDSFLVTTGPALFRVTILSNTTQSLTDITPNLGGPASLQAIDIHPGTGDIYLHDGLSHQVFRCSPPFALGMPPNLVVPVAGGARAMCLDSPDYPPSVVTATSSTTSRFPLDGGAAIDIVYAGGGGIDGHPLGKNKVYLTNKGENTVDASTGSPNLVQNLNVVGFCAPVVLRPMGVAHNVLNAFTYVLAEDGLNPNCYGGGSGPNQVVSLPPALGPLLPQIHTNTVDSGITGTGGDIALVLDDFPFPAPYGFGCEAPSTGKRPELKANGAPGFGNSFFALDIAAAPAAQPVFLLFGVQPLQLALPSGCTALVLTAVDPIFVGLTSASGKLTVPAPIPAAGIPPGLQVYLQGVTKDGGQLVLSNGLQLHFAL